MTVLHRRGEEINLSILLKCLFKLKFSKLDYCDEFIRHVSKLVLTAFDYHTIFYKLSKKWNKNTYVTKRPKRKYRGIISESNYYFPKNSKKNFM